MAEEIISTFADQLGSELVDIIAGKEGKMFTVHRDPLFAKCDYLRKILIPATNGKRPYIDFKAEETGAVSLLVNFVYRGSVPTSDEYIKAKANPSSSFLSTKFSVFRPSRPIFGHSMSETRLSPFGKLSAQHSPSYPVAHQGSVYLKPQNPQSHGSPSLYPSEENFLACSLQHRNQIIQPRRDHRWSINAHRARTLDLGDDGLELCMGFASEDKNFFKALCKSRLRPKQEFDSLIEALNDGAYDMVEKEPFAFGAGVPHGGVVAPGKSIFDRSSGFTSSVDLTKMKE